jgi:hypothetical protein
VNVSGQQALVLAGEYLPTNRESQQLVATAGNLRLPSGGAVLQRVTMVASRPDNTVVLLRADYSSPILAPGTYDSLAGGAKDSGARESSARSAAQPAPLLQYAQERGEPGARARGGIIDVYA